MAKIRAKIVEATIAGREFRVLDRRKNELLNSELDELKDIAVEELQAAAPQGNTGTLKRGIRARKQPGGRPGFDITIHARAEDGYDYAAVTRVGHEKRVIKSTRGVILGRKGPINARLRVTWNPNSRKTGTTFRTQVPGVGHGKAGNVIRDWAFDPIFDMEETFLPYAAKKLSSRLQMRVFTG